MGRGTLPERARAKKTQKINFRTQQKRLVIGPGAGFGAILGPGRDLKIDQKRPRSGKGRSRTRSGSDFQRFSEQTRFSSRLRDRFRSSGPSKSDDVIEDRPLFAFSEKHRKRTLRAPVLRPKIDENRRRTGRKSPKLPKKLVLGALEIHAFFCMRKKTEKKSKQVKPTPVRRDARGRRGGKEGCIILQKSACRGKTCEEFCKGVHADLWHPFSTPRRGAADDGKRAESAIEVAVKGASPPGGGSGGGILAGGPGGVRDDGKRATSAIEVALRPLGP